LIRAHKDAVLTRLREDGILTGCTFEGVVEARPHRYATLFIDSGLRSSDRLLGSSVTATFTVLVHSVGVSPDQAQLVADRVLTQLVDWTPAVDGFRCRRLRHTLTVPVQRDPDGLPPVFFCVDEFTLTTQPSPATSISL
jgi:hypothetical protein